RYLISLHDALPICPRHEETIICIDIVQPVGELIGAFRAGGVGASIGLVMIERLQALVPRPPGQITGYRVYDAMPPMNAQHSLTAIVLSQLHITGETIDMQLREPHGRVILDPGDRPAFTVFQFAKTSCGGSHPS